MRRNETHEDLSRDEAVHAPADRQFGLVFTAFFGLVGVWPLLWGRSPRWWSLLLAVLFLVAALIAPRVLAPLNRVWMRIGLLLHRCVSPLVLGLVYFSTVTPIAVVLRRIGKDPLRLRFDRQAETYWIDRRPPGPAGHTMSKQF
jgi:hypothetical protein